MRENAISQKEKLKSLAASATRKTEVKALLAETKAQWENARAQAILAEERLKTETADVERLDKKSLPNLLLAVTGKMEDKRAAETAEANEAQALYDSANTRAEELHGQVVSLELELRSLGNCDKDLEILTNAMTAEILAEGGDLAVEVGEIKDRMEKNAAEAQELEELLAVGRRLNRLVAEMLPILWNAAEKEKRRQADGPLPPYSHHHVFKSEINTILDGAETYLPMLIAAAKSFTSSIVDLPPLGSLQTVKNTFEGTYTVSTLTQIEGTVKELETMAERVDRSMEKIGRVKQTREEAAALARNEWIEALMR
jgi:hypothetical protein